MPTKKLLWIALMLACVNEANAQTDAVAPSPPPLPARTLASLLAEGYEMQAIRVFQDKIWFRKPSGEGVTFICDRGRIGSANFEAYRNRNYDQIPCSPAP
jgi:hypothetical protein